jgi:hypothetical protein
MPGAQDTTELVVASHGDVYVAPVGTALPTTVSGALNAAFNKLGLITEDGVSVSVAPEIEAFRAWQRRQAVRRELINQDISVSFALEQWNAENVIFAFGGGEVSEPSAGQFRYDFPDGDDALDERAIVVDWQDGPDSQHRLVFERGNVMEAVEFQLVRNALAVLPITFGILAADDGGSPGYYLADDDAFHS